MKFEKREKKDLQLTKNCKLFFRVEEGETLLDEFIAIVIASGPTSDEEFEYLQKLKDLGFKTKSIETTMAKSKWRTILKKWTKSENNVKQLVRKFDRSIIKRTEY